MYYYESEIRSRAAELRRDACKWRRAQEARRGQDDAPPARGRAVARLRALIHPRLVG
ncbi:hypothetical protein [Streptomyces silvisoli]|uniref:Uncharacterized protein n=1 Tax=Streptomyces silvisoli TaxID=3034235 RepID=A0ABT5ZHI8_9ACTN|nr:hypothetical protein [Streptomyces silvisoli]MDF3289276.1 hypothetical protein [Streptomyces silvisoli]